MAQFDVLDLLRPDRGEARDGVRSHAAPQPRARFQNERRSMPLVDLAVLLPVCPCLSQSFARPSVNF